MSDRIKRLVESLSRQEERLLQTEFLAPCVRGGQVRTRVAGLIYTFAPRPSDFEGWAVFLPVSESEAEALEEPPLPLLSGYLRLFKQVRARLACTMENRTWLAYPVNESDARQRLGGARPFPVHLVAGGAQFEQVEARFDGASFWFEDLDRRADPAIADKLRGELKGGTPPERLQFKDLTPEMRTAYGLALQRTMEGRKRMRRRRAEDRLDEALRVAGGSLQSFRDHGGYWVVEWATRDGERHTSAISKRDLTVISSGICLSGLDRDFDLQSLVGVIEGRDRW